MGAKYKIDSVVLLLSMCLLICILLTKSELNVLNYWQSEEAMRQTAPDDIKNKAEINQDLSVEQLQRLLKEANRTIAKQQEHIEGLESQIRQLAAAEKSVGEEKAKMWAFTSRLVEGAMPSLSEDVVAVDKGGRNEDDVAQLHEKILLESSEATFTVDRLRKENARLAAVLDTAAARPPPRPPEELEAEKAALVKEERERGQAEREELKKSHAAEMSRAEEKLRRVSDKLEQIVKDADEKDWRVRKRPKFDPWK